MNTYTLPREDLQGYFYGAYTTLCHVSWYKYRFEEMNAKSGVWDRFLKSSLKKTGLTNHSLFLRV